jgi:glucose-6-phosphate isomerase
MIDLKGVSGLPVLLDREKAKLEFSGSLEPVEPSVRKLEEMKDVLLDSDFEGESELYYMYRGVSKEEDKEILKEHNLRYDLTLLKPVSLGDEFNKTYGHYHPEVPGTNFTYPEIYEVLYGEAYYILQRVDFEDERQVLREFLVVVADVGDKVVIPPGYGHVTINPSLERPLLMANITADGFKSVYEPFKKARGAGFYLTTSGEWLENQNYNLGSVKFDMTSAKGGELLKLEGEPMYLSCIKNPEKFRFLTHPQDFIGFWSELSLRRLGRK